MLFLLKNKQYVSTEYMRTNALLSAYYIIQNYPLRAADILMDNYIQQQHGMSLKNTCVELLLNLTYYRDNDGNLIMLFKNRKYDQLASLITYGNGAIPGSKILQTALKE